MCVTRFKHLKLIGLKHKRLFNLFYRLAFLILVFGVYHFMNDLKSEFKKLESLLNALIAEQQLLRKSNQRLTLELQQMEKSYQVQSDELQKMQTELKNAKLASGFNAKGEEAELTKAKLGSLMREIDRCIASLNE